MTPAQTERAPWRKALELIGETFGVTSPPSRLRVGSAISLAGGPLAEGLKAFRAAHPELVLALDDDELGPLLEKLRHRSLDVVFGYATTLPTAAQVRLLWREPLFVLLPSSHPLGERHSLLPAELSGSRVLLTPGQRFEPIGEQLIALERDGRLTLVDVSVERETLAGLVAIGEGVAFGGAAFLAAHRPGVVARRVQGRCAHANLLAFFYDDTAPRQTSALLAAVQRLAAEPARQ